MALLTYTQFDFLVRKTRKFDTDVRLSPSVADIYDIVVDIVLPNYVYYDIAVYYVRKVEALTDPFSTSKEDTTSFFSMYEHTNDTIASTYVSTNLKVMQKLSETMLKPVSRFTSVKPVSATSMTGSGTDDYVALDFKDIAAYDTLEIVRSGLSFVMTSVTPDMQYPSNIDQFVDYVDVTNVRWAGITDAIDIPGNNETQDYCSFYYGIFKITNDATYYFKFQASSCGTFDIDRIQVFDQWVINNTDEQETSVQLTKGYHTFLIRQYGTAASTNDVVHLYVKEEDVDPWLSFSVSNASSVGIELLSFPVRKHLIVSQGSEFVREPYAIHNVSLDSLYLKQYRPTIVLARKYSALLQNEFMRIFYYRAPDNVKHSTLLEGTIDQLHTNVYDLGRTGHGVVFDCNLSNVNSPYVTYEYTTPVYMSQFEMTDTVVYDNTSYSGKQCKGFTFSIVDEKSLRLQSHCLIDCIDLDNCVNVEYIFTNTDDTTYVTVYKEDIIGPTIIVFKNAMLITQITLRDPIIGGLEWGQVTAFRVYGKASELVKLIDNKGEESVIETVENNRLLSVDYDDIGFIPSVFDHKNIPPDVQYGSEFLMFCLVVSGDTGSIDILGNIYSIQNNANAAVYNEDYILHTGQLNIADSRYFDVYTYTDRAQVYDFTYLCYNNVSGSIQQTDYTSITITITNNDSTALSNYEFDAVVPNIGVGYTAADSSLNNVPIAAVLSDNTLTDDVTLWDTNTVRIVVQDVPFEGTETVVLTQGSFTAPGSVSGATGGIYSISTDLLQLPLIITRIPNIQAGAQDDVYILQENTVPTINNIQIYDVPAFITLGTVLVTDYSGENRVNVEVTIDVSSITHLYTCPLRVYDAVTREPVDTVGINLDGSVVNDYTLWDGYQISFKIPELSGALSKLFLIRIHEFAGTTSTFIHEIQTDMVANYHFSGSLVNNIDSSVGVDNGVFYNADKEFSYYSAVEFINNGTARLTQSTNVTDFTFSFWFKTVDYDSGLCCFAQEDTLPAATTDLSFTIDAQGYLKCTIHNTPNIELKAQNKLYTDNQWHHVVLTFEDSVGINLYVDKLLLDTDVSISSRQITTTYLYLGWADQYSVCAIDELRVYTKVLSLVDIEVLYTVFTGIYNDIAVRFEESSNIIEATSMLTSLFDLSASDGTPLYIYKYININEAIVRWIT